VVLFNPEDDALMRAVAQLSLLGVVFLDRVRIYLWNLCQYGVGVVVMMLVGYCAMEWDVICRRSG
jgi:hypothetical protein